MNRAMTHREWTHTSARRPRGRGSRCFAPIVCFGSMLLTTLFPAVAAAHEVRPAYLQIRQTGAASYDMLWKVPGRGENLRLGLYVKLPDDCASVAPPRTEYADGAFIERSSIHRAGGFEGEVIYIEGLSATMTDVLVRIEWLNGATETARLTPESPSFVVTGNPSQLRVAATYLRIGVEHILLGIDHLLFVLALVLLVNEWRTLIATITAFTVAHSITLAGATLGWVRVPGPPIEVCIALSILFVAAEIAQQRRGRPGLTARRPWCVAFAFGLLHGFGFASALGEVGLPQSAIPLALLFFNAGVELGQLCFIALVQSVVVLGRRLPIPAPAWAWRVPPYAIGSTAAFWLLQRLEAFV